MMLRPRQEELVERSLVALRERGNTLAVAPTGAGKTVMLSAVVDRSIEGSGRALVLQHRDELVEQNRRTFHRVAGATARSGVVDGNGKDWHKPVTFAMVQTLARAGNLDHMPAHDLIVIDEAHHAAAKSYKGIVEKARELNPSVRLYGVTATPNRGDKKGLVGTFDNVADQITVGELIATGALVRPRTFVVDLGVREELSHVKRSSADFDMSEVAKIMDHQIHNDRIVEEWRKMAGDRLTVAFASTVDHARHVMETFRTTGVAATMVTGEMPDGERKATLQAFDRGEYQVLVNVAVLTEGWDCQPVSCVLLLRPSSYASTMIQMIGRGLRRLEPEKYPGRPSKSDCIVIDFGTSVLTHGTLEQSIDLDPHKGAPKTKQCPGCQATIPMSSRECAICGYVFLIETPPPDAEAGEKEVLKDFILTEIDLFKQSPFRWEDLWGDSTTLAATAFDAWAIAVFYGGQWHAIGGGDNKHVTHLAAGEKMLVLAAADDWMRENGDKSAAAKSKRWLHEPASEKQLAHLGLTPMAGLGVTKYKAACHLTWKFNEKAVQTKLADSVRGMA
jgi:superfamily II DNA or RNA helicase